MKNNKNPHYNKHEEETSEMKPVNNDDNIEVMDVDSSIDEEPAADEADNLSAEIEKLKNLLASKEEEIAKEKKEYLFLMADFENFRKNKLKESAELLKTASSKVLTGLLPIVDDFERGLEAIRDTYDAEAVKEGMRLIYNKFVKYLNDNGVKAMETNGNDFNSEIHEAVAVVPADDETPKGKIKDTVQKGYTLNDKVIRHAKVVVAQ